VQTKLIVFIVASAIAGLAGALYASQANFVSSDLMGTLLSTEAVVWVAVGGRRTLVGALLGALVVQGVGFWLSGIAVDYWKLFLGALFIALVLGGSTGLVGVGKWMWERGGSLVAGNR
jgi:urea transport system permease protein